MNYIVSRRFRGKAISGKDVNLPANTKAEERNGVIYVNNDPICRTASQVSHENFARNDDSQGMARGNITYAIAFSNRKRFNKNKTRKQRFTDDEIEMLENDYSHFLISDIDVVLFNNDFFAANIFELKELASKLKIKI